MEPATISEASKASKISPWCRKVLSVPELADMVMRLLDARDLRSLTLVNKHFHALADRHLYQST